MKGDNATWCHFKQEWCALAMHVIFSEQMQLQRKACLTEDFALKTNFKGHAESWFYFQVLAPLVEQLSGRVSKPWENQPTKSAPSSMRCAWVEMDNGSCHLFPESVWAKGSSNSGGLSSHLLIFSSSHLFIFTSFHLVICTPSHLHIF